MHRRSLLTAAGALVFGGFGVRSTVRAQDTARIRDVIYRKKHGVALTMDIFKPARSNGAGVLFMVSGGWFSSHEAINPGFAKPFTDRGYTVFAVVHGSQPKYAIPEIVEDIDRAVRFVRHHAREYGVDPERLGISGGSAGGHLSLMQGARGTDGNPQAKDPIDRESSRVQAVACFYPPTDFLNYGQPNRNALTAEELKRFRAAFGAKSNEPSELEAVAKAISPITYVTPRMPPTMIIHGDQDQLVPIQQAEVILKKIEASGVPCRLVVKEGKAHGWPELATDIYTLAEWFDQHLQKK